MEDPDFVKQNDRYSAARPLTYFPTKLLKQGFDVLPRQAAAYRSRENQLKGALVLPPHDSILPPFSTRRGFRSAVCWIRITLKISDGKVLVRATTTLQSRLQDLVVRKQNNQESIHRIMFSSAFWDGHHVFILTTNESGLLFLASTSVAFACSMLGATDALTNPSLR